MSLMKYDEETYRVRYQTMELLSLWSLGPRVVAHGSVLVRQMWKISKKKKGLKSLLLGFYRGIVISS